MTTPQPASPASDVEKTDGEKLKELQARAKSLSAALIELGKLSLKDPELLLVLDKTVARLSDADSFAAAITSLKVDGQSLSRAIRDARVQRFSSVLAEFIQARRAAGVEVREVATSMWRVGMLEIEGDPAGSRARARYAQQELDTWRPVTTRSDLERIASDATAALTASEIAPGELGRVFREAYEVLARGGLAGSGQGRRVRLVDLRREVHLAVLRQALLKPDGEKRVAKIIFPHWAFAYNADRYRRVQRDLPQSQRLNFETGSQQDHRNGLSVAMNGLDPKTDHKAYCYVEPTPGEGNA